MALTRGGMPIPDTLYARAGDAAIAYQVFGSGEHRVVAVPGAIGNVGLMWEWPPYHHFFERWGSFATVAQFDKRGVGASDRLEHAASTEEGMEDFRVVMDAVGWERATIYALSDGGPRACQFAARYPERVEKLILHGTYARLVRGDGYDIGLERADHDRFCADWAAQSGTHETLIVSSFAPSQAGDEAFLGWVRRAERLSGRPRDLLAAISLNAEIDVRDVLAQVRVPTLVVHARQDQAFPVEHGRYLAASIPGATLFEYDGEHFPWLVGVDESLDAIERFVTGAVSSSTRRSGARHAAVHRHLRVDGAGGSARRPRVEVTPQPSRRGLADGPFPPRRRRSKHHR